MTNSLRFCTVLTTHHGFYPRISTDASIFVIPIYITIYKEDSLFCVHISKFQFYSLKYNYLLNF